MAEAKPRAQRIRVGPIEIAYEEQGEGSRAFVLVHGFTGSRDDFADVHEALAAEGRTLVLDLRGHGGSSNLGDPGAYSLELLVADLLGFLDALGIARCDLLGHSLGGMVALRFALEHPQRLASLVLMDTSPEPIALMPVAMMQAGAKLGREQGMGRLFEMLRQGADGHRPEAMRRTEAHMGPDRYWGRIRAKIEAMDPEAMQGLAAVLAEHTPATPRLGEIACPTLVIVGEQDAPFLAPSRRMAEAIPGATLAVVPQAAHSPQLENQAAWLAAVREHLQRSRSSLSRRSGPPPAP